MSTDSIFQYYTDKDNSPRVGLANTARKERIENQRKRIKETFMPDGKNIAENIESYWENGKLSVEGMEKLTHTFENYDQALLKGIKDAYNASDALDLIHRNAEDAKQSFSGLRGTFKSFGSTLKGIGTNLLNFGVSMAVSLAFDAVLQGIDTYINRYDDYASKLDETAAKWKEQKSAIESHKESIGNISDEYSTLSSGVDAYGQNVSLTSDQYERYIDLSNQIADMYPDLVEGYTAQGDAILKCRDNLSALTQAMKDEQEAYYNTILQDAPDTWTTFGEAVSTDGGFFDLDNRTLEAQREAVKQWQGYLELAKVSDTDLTFAMLDALPRAMQEVFNKSGLENLDSGWLNTVWIDKDKFNEAQNILTGYIDSLTNQINARVESSAYPIIDAYTRKATSNLSQDAQNMINQITSSFTFDNFYKEILGDDADYTRATAWINSHLISLFENGSTAGDGLVEAWNKVTNAVTEFKDSSISLDKFGEFSSEFENTLEELGIDAETREYFVKLIFDKVEIADGVSPEDAIDNIISRMNGVGGDGKAQNGATVFSPFEVKLELKPPSAWLNEAERDTIKEFLSTLSHDELQYLYESAELANSSLSDLQKSINEFRNSQVLSGSFSLSLETTTASLDKAVSAFSTVKSAIQEYNKNGYVTIDTMKSLISLDDKYLLALTNEQGALDLTTQKYEDLVKAQALEIKASLLQESIDSVNAIDTEAEALAYLSSAQADSAEATLSLADAKWSEALATAAVRDAEQGTGSMYQEVVLNARKAYEAKMQYVDSCIESALAVGELSGASSELEGQLKDEKEALEASKEALEKQKSALEDMKNNYDDAINAIKDLIEWTQNYIKQTKEDEIEALEDKKSHIDELIEAKKELLEAEKEEYNWNKTISEKQNTVASDALSASIASLDDSGAGKKAYKEATDRLDESRSDIKDTLYEHGIDTRIKALDELKEQSDEYYDSEIDKIQEFLNDEVALYKAACEMIDNDNGTLYSTLLNYARTYTTTTTAEFDYMWNSAQTAMQQYNLANLGTFDLLNNLQSRMYEVDEAIKTIAESISTYESQIDTVQTKLDELGKTAQTTVAHIKTAQQESEWLKENSPKWKFEWKGQEYTSSIEDRNKAVSYILSRIYKTTKQDIPSGIVYGGIKAVSAYAKGTKSAKGGVSNVDEDGLYTELIPYQVGKGRYTILPEGNPVFSKPMTNELFNFASDPSTYLEHMQPDLKKSYIAVNKQTQVTPSININISGDATQSTVKALRAEADNIVKRATTNVMNIALRNKHLI